MEHQAVSRARLLWLGVPALVILLLTQAPAQTSNDDRQNIPEPAERHVGPNSDYIKSALVGPAARKLNVPRNVVNIFQSAKEAENATEFDEILDSSWFTNRNFWSPLPPDKFGEGPAQPGRAPDRGPWAVTKCKAEGIMPGFQIRDHKGD
jgi:hypothetical protein